MMMAVMLARMGFGRGRIHWYDLVLFAFAAVIVYPDEVLDWLGARFGWHCGWRHVVALEAVACASVAIFVVLLQPVYPKLPWWEPLLMVGMLALLRLGMWCVRRAFGFED